MIISSRARCLNGKPYGWFDRIAAQDVLDGLSNTFLAGEMHVPVDKLASLPENGPMFNGADLAAFARLAGPGVPLARGPRDTTAGLYVFGSWHPGVCHFVWGDGSVRPLRVDTSSRLLGALSNRKDGQVPSGL